MRIKSVFTLMVLTILSISIFSCHKDGDEIIQDIGGAGTFYAINETTNDSVLIQGEGIVLSDGSVSPHVLEVKGLSTVKLIFVPNEKYKKYRFKVTYTVDTGSSIEGQGDEYSYSFHVHMLSPDGFTSDLKVSMSAKSEEQQITSFGSVLIRALPK